MEKPTQNQAMNLDDWTVLNKQVIARASTDAAYREMLLSDPRAAMEQAFGQQLPATLQVKVIEQEPNTLYLVLPRAGAGNELSEDALDAVVGGTIFTKPISDTGNAPGLLATSYDPKS